MSIVTFFNSFLQQIRKENSTAYFIYLDWIGLNTFILFCTLYLQKNFIKVSISSYPNMLTGRM
jgi:hypothetical protein